MDRRLVLKVLKAEQDATKKLIAKQSLDQARADTKKLLDHRPGDTD